jgi:ATP synthase protein I
MGGGDDKQPPDLRELEQRLKRARKPERKGEQPPGRGAALGFGFRIAVDLVCAVAVGFGLGYFLDWWLGTSPWFLLILIPLGIVAGILNVVRAAKSEEGKRQAGFYDGGES